MGGFIWPTVHKTKSFTHGRVHLPTVHNTNHLPMGGFIWPSVHNTDHLTNGRLYLTYSTQHKTLPVLLSLILSGTFLASRCCCCCRGRCCCCCSCWSGSGVEGACHISCTHPGCSLSIHMYVLTQGLTDRTKNLLPLFLYTWRNPDFEAGVKETVEWDDILLLKDGKKGFNNSFCFSSSFAAFSDMRRLPHEFSMLADW